jgi:xanthine/CO dehydrogenase XdhC/CoxF family maturation factor
MPLRRGTFGEHSPRRLARTREVRHPLQDSNEVIEIVPEGQSVFAPIAATEKRSNRLHVIGQLSGCNGRIALRLERVRWEDRPVVVSVQLDLRTEDQLDSVKQALNGQAKLGDRYHRASVFHSGGL